MLRPARVSGHGPDQSDDETSLAEVFQVAPPPRPDDPEPEAGRSEVVQVPPPRLFRRVS